MKSVKLTNMIDKLWLLSIISAISFNVSAQDTLTINRDGNCFNSSMIILSHTIEDCNLNYGSIDRPSFHHNISSIMGIGNITTSTDSITCTWNIVDTAGNLFNYTSVHSMVLTDGCYNFKLTVYCAQDSAIIINQPYYIGFVGINELVLDDETPIKITDLMGRECKLTDNQVMLYYYSNGYVKQVIKSE